ncbi:hypothetical protein Q0590_29020 [Rhodocytophaga aerolata]|uniref:Response regulator n=1 Tax=Rhodocytophaga aerolata TaxID=455078 RepID=A0ABT8RGS3_9BACT|nr:hypothetical protein [Rhodocytophaga aerolata]MDO1450353.1 hypothetical protein [Rhodocytophaga aerolata]
MPKHGRPINVLFIDDEKDDMQDFMLAANQARVIIEPYSNIEEGFAALEDKLYKFDAVILDAQGFIDDSQTKGTENFKSLLKGQKKLKEISSKIIDISLIVYIPGKLIKEAIG